MGTRLVPALAALVALVGGSSMARTADEIQRDIDRIGGEVTSVYESAERLDARREQIRDELADEALSDQRREELLTRLDELELEHDSLWARYDVLTDQLGELYSELDAVCPERLERAAKAEDPDDLEFLQLQQRLNQIADEQTGAVRQWNADPREELREAFERRMTELHQEFDEVHQRVAALLERRKSNRSDEAK